MVYYFCLQVILFVLILHSSKTSLSTERYGHITGDVILGGLFPVHEYGSTRETCGAISHFRGIQRLEAMLFAIDQINDDKHLLPGIKLGALILDTCSDDNYALEQSLRFVRSRLASSTCACNNTSTSEASYNDNVFGVVGATLSSVSVTVANLLRLFQLPQISYASTTPKLSESSFDFFARTVPSDSNQARAIVDILQRLNFTYVNAIYSHGDYGEGGFREFKRLLKVLPITPLDDETVINRKKQQRICIADEQRLKRDASVQDTRDVLQTMIDRIKSDVQVRVYVAFLTKEDARKLLQAIKLINVTDRPVLIASDAWGKESSVIINGDTDEIAVGALTLELISIQPFNFDRYFNSLKPDIIRRENSKDIEDDSVEYTEQLTSVRNPWFNEFWENRFGCNLTSSTCRKYQLNETNWDGKLQFIVDATYVFAQALHFYFHCTSSTCFNVSLNHINGTKLFQMILENIFLMPDFRQIQFNSERFVPGHYRIYNYRRSHSASSDMNASLYEYVSVGEWKVGRNEYGQLSLNINSIVWPTSNNSNSSSSTIIPISRCSEPCRAGELKQYQGDACCWVCTPCNETSIVTGTDEQERCEPCPDLYWPTPNRTSCSKLDISYTEILSAQALVPATLAIMGNLVTLFVVIVFYLKRGTPVVKASGKELCFIMLAGIHLCYLMTLPILLKPHVITCIIQRVGIGLGFSMMYAALLTKTNRIARIFDSTKKQGRLHPQFISPNSQVAICGCLIMIQLLLSLLWLAYEPPLVDFKGHGRLVIPKCRVNKQSFLFSLTYNVLLVLICTMYAIRTRKVPENFNETKFIGFTCYTTCIIWLAFLPIYFTAYETDRHQMHITTLCITISLCATVALACLFSPKIYIILFHPEKNMRISSQLKAQANSFKFTAYIPAKPEAMSNEQIPNHDISSSDGPSKSVVSNDNEENCQQLVWKKCVSFKGLPDKERSPDNNKQKTSIVVKTSHSENHLHSEKYKCKTRKYTYDDSDSLNSNTIQYEGTLL